MAEKQEGWPPGFPVFQVPNTPLRISLAAAVAARLTGGAARRFSYAVSLLARGVWAYGEVTQGANWYRRLVGAGFLIDLVVRGRR